MKKIQVSKDTQDKLERIFWSAIWEWLIPAAFAYTFYDLMGKNDTAFVVSLVMFSFSHWLFRNMLEDSNPDSDEGHY